MSSAKPTPSSEDLDLLGGNLVRSGQDAAALTANTIWLLRSESDSGSPDARAGHTAPLPAGRKTCL